MTASANISVRTEEIADFCRQNHIGKLALFGSILRPDFRSDSDVDVLVEFDAGFTPGFSFIRMQNQLSVLFGRKVDLNTPECLIEGIRSQILEEAEVLYVPPQ